MGAAALPVAMFGMSIMQARAQRQAGRSQQAMYRVSAEQSRMAARQERDIARLNASAIKENARRQKDAIDRAGIRHLAKVQTGYSVSGVESGSGSAMDVAVNQIYAIESKKAEAIMSGEERAQQALYAGERAAWNAEYTGQIQSLKGDMAYQAGRTQSAFTMMGGALNFGMGMGMFGGGGGGGSGYQGAFGESGIPYAPQYDAFGQ